MQSANQITTSRSAASRRRRAIPSKKTECTRLCTGQKLRRIPLATKTDGNGATPVPSKLRLPRTLPRPVLGEVDLTSSHNHLAHIPPEYVREKLLGSLPSMRTSLAAVKCTLNSTRLAKAAQILANDIVSAYPPTHMLAIHGTASSSSNTQAVSLFPVHDIVFAAHCATFPVLPSSQPTTTDSTISVPIVPMRLPSPETFSILQGYLYTQQPSFLRSALKTPLEAEGDFLRLAAHAHKIKGLWANACLLGVVDDRVFEVVEEAWTRVLDAMQTASS
ncbi:hypothetical protein MIND_01174600 [Mycena indigotica]|uniref:Uncharacterized protein n=1 Tax=Mycena indigotica TaxID=2126181 RepID=A0A8H6S4P8_9AGAR|nr:uncharacterized protein MIND_01174600 [Mycena indigotica]KAF7292761.1 hypothetical protein MIND_01174600 [Mycena indigotica]